MLLLSTQFILFEYIRGYEKSQEQVRPKIHRLCFGVSEGRGCGHLRPLDGWLLAVVLIVQQVRGQTPILTFEM
jgi:hypothetical protein